MKRPTMVFVPVSVGALGEVLNALQAYRRGLEYEASAAYSRGDTLEGDRLVAMCGKIEREVRRIAEKMDRVYTRIERQAIREIM